MTDAVGPRLSILVVSWECRDLLVRCLESLRHVAIDHEVLVVDNASTDGTADTVRRDFPGVRVFEAGGNIGFSRANNLAIGHARGALLLLLNPDTEVRRGAVESMARFMEEHPSAGICTTRLWNPDGSPQPSVLAFPTPARQFLQHTMLHRWVRRRVDGRTRRVEAVSGAALCIRKACVDAVGPLDPDFFMFYEDVDLCRRVDRAGWEVWFVDGPGIVHVKSGASTGEALTRTLLASLRSSLLYFRKHDGRSRTGTMRAIVLVGSCARSARALLLLLGGRDRPGQRAKLRAYGRMLRWSVGLTEL